MATVGVLVNPIAGMGGRVGLHGTDGEIWALAVARGAIASSGDRATRALRVLGAVPGLNVLTGPGDLGEIAAVDAGLNPRVIDIDMRERHTAAGSRKVVAAMVEAGVDLVLFAGGDGTARDVLAAVTPSTTVLGIPAGVKIRSAAFARSPEVAGEVARAFLAGASQTFAAEVVDAERPDSWDQQVYGVCRVPLLRDRVQPMKSSAVKGDEAELTALARGIAAGLRPHVLYVLGPGATTGRVAQALGLRSSIVGVDAILNGEFIGRDLSEDRLLALLSEHPQAQCLLGVIGGQGFILGRGNQQLSAEVLRRLRRERITLLAARSKIVALQPARLWIDVDDAALAEQLRGYWRVLVGANESIMMRVEIPGFDDWRAHVSA